MGNSFEFSYIESECFQCSFVAQPFSMAVMARTFGRKHGYQMLLQPDHANKQAGLVPASLISLLS